ncbi:bacterio-opsin activator domain-containing protein [Haloarcula salinisoli]|uniref:Helix-turn-helix domain-containing protein n=1 Tax=Haloarcula salinisoli TaxID=2487746 RepID=A0A8J7YAF3_9EURY|nr:bacterio-opsin activator domain-containing protein [Halomicroarcula salinisoli]MBX0286167.1 helix-turn-helix domain-containing protein [Halomicroarcula salinisoli]MBX0302345.1 helix-turn-helix domain-containing protein [Halomicroarcula salinisoli]
MRDDGGPDTEPNERMTAATPRRRLRFHSDSLGELFHEVLAEGVTVHIDSVVQLDDGTHLEYWTTTHRDPQRLVETVEQLPTKLDAELLSTVDDTHRFEVHGASESLFGVLEEFGAVAKSATYDTDGFEVVAELPVDVDTDTIVEAVQSVYPSLELVDGYTVETVSDFRQRVKERLTERQLTVLQVAYFSGYYERPRRRTGAELADRLGISKQAFHDHLRKAHATVFETLIGGGGGFGEVDR